MASTSPLIKSNTPMQSSSFAFPLAVDEVYEAFMSIIKKVGKTYRLSINGQAEGAFASLGNITLTVDQPGAPSPITPMNSVAFEVFAGAVQASFGSDVVTAPSFMTGNTDTRHYVSLVFANCSHAQKKGKLTVIERTGQSVSLDDGVSTLAGSRQCCI